MSQIQHLVHLVSDIQQTIGVYSALNTKILWNNLDKGITELATSTGEDTGTPGRPTSEDESNRDDLGESFDTMFYSINSVL